MMKFYFATLLSVVVLNLSSLYAQQADPVLMKINGKGISLSEFEYIYNKNNTNNAIDKKSLDEYVDLFVNFKLKVEEALAQGLDTTQAFKSEFEMYRNQLAEQYMTDKAQHDLLLREAYERKKEEREVAHLLVRIADGGTAADTLAAYNKAMACYARMQKEGFDKVARESSDDPNAAQNGGYVGWISAFRTPYTFETMAYNTPVGQVSKPVRTFLGYHLVKVLNKRTSPGEIKVAHILLTTDRQDSTTHPQVKLRVDSLYQRLKSGEDFGELAAKYSQDPGSASQKGELPWFGSGRMIPEFEKAAFALQTKGELSEPLRSAFGWHIIRLIDKKPLASFDEQQTAMENELKQSDRYPLINAAYIDGLKAEYNFRTLEPALADYHTLYNNQQPGDSLFNDALGKLQAPLATFADKTLTQAEFNRHLNFHSYRGGVRSDYLNEAYKRFSGEKLRAYELTRLAHKHPDYRNLMNEYHDGILLFEVMNRQVWDKAAKDAEGLAAYFNANKEKYTWDKPHYKGRIVYAKDKATLKAAQNIVKRADKDSVEKYLNQRLNDSIKYVKTEKGLWVEGENPLIDAKIFKKGKYTPDEEYPYYFVTGKKLGTRPEDYTDVKGMVTADYQDHLEKNWLDDLRRKYPVEVDEKVLKTVKKN